MMRTPTYALLELARDHYVINKNSLLMSTAEIMAHGRDELLESEYMRTQREMEDISFQCARMVKLLYQFIHECVCLNVVTSSHNKLLLFHCVYYGWIWSHTLSKDTNY